jgi:glycosyltransferase involved in cell wall biosynthesis
MLAARLARRLRGECRFVFVCLDALGALGQELRAEGFLVSVLARRPGVDWRSAVHLAQVLRRERVDLVHAHQYTPFFYTLLARVLCRRPPILFTEHGRHYPDFPRAKRIMANRLLLERRDRVVGVGRAVRQALIDNEGLPPGRTEVIYNGVDTAGFANGGHDEAVIRREIGVGLHDLVILQVARLDYLKDHATAIRTVGRVAVHHPGVRLVLVGEGPEGDKIHALVNRHHVEANVRFLGLRKDVGRLLRAADLFLLTSISEGIPLTVIEAMAAGLPVIATRVGGLAEMVEDGTTGHLAPSGDDAALAGYILRLAGEPELRRAMGRRGQERARSVFSEGQMHGHYLALYRTMLRGGRGPSARRSPAGVCG